MRPGAGASDGAVHLLIMERRFSFPANDRSAIGTAASACMFLIALFGCSARALATDYYISSSGKDNNSGTSVAAAWQTCRPANLFHFAAGDRILFEGGQTFG